MGSNTTSNHAFNAHSPWNYVTRAQARALHLLPGCPRNLLLLYYAQGSKVIPVVAADETVQYLWIGNQWVSSSQPGGGGSNAVLTRTILYGETSHCSLFRAVGCTGTGNPRNHDLLFWAVLQFNASGAVQEMAWADTTTLSLP